MILDEEWFVYWRYNYVPDKAIEVLEKLWEEGTDEQRERMMKLLKGEIKNKKKDNGLFVNIDISCIYYG